MNKLTLQAGVTMSSQQIAELVGSRHDSVKRTIERLGTQRKLKQLPVIQLPPLVEVKNHLGQTVLEYIFSGDQGERDSYVVVAQLSPEFTAKLVDEWKRLKNGSSIPQTYAAALLEAGRLAQLAEQQAEQLAMAAPKIEFVDKYVTANGNKGFRETAKLLNISEPEFRDFLTENKIMYYLGKTLTGYAQHIDAGRITTKAVIDGTGTARNQAMFTPKGVEWIAGVLAKSKARKLL